MKPGFVTSEFWSTVFVHLLSVVALVLSSTGHVFDSTKLDSLVPVAALIASGIAQSFYSLSRGKVKAAVVTADPAVVNVPVADNEVPPFNG